jgi:hypothetical protein
MRSIAEPAVLLRVHAEMPARMKLAADAYREGWNLARERSAQRIEKKIKAQGWHFIKASGSLMASGVGATPQKAITCALEHALVRIDSHLNVVEIRRIHSAQYPWFCLARVLVLLYRIQECAALGAPEAPSSRPLRPVNKLPFSPALTRETTDEAMQILQPMGGSSQRFENRPQG